MHDSLGFLKIREQDAQAATVTKAVEGKELVLEVDTGASVTIIPNKIFKEKLGHLKLRLANTSLKTYTGAVLPLCGETEVVEYQGQSAKLPLIVAEVDGKPAILGRNWLSFVKLNWKELFNVSSLDFVAELSARYKGVFGPGVGKIKEFEARLCVHSETTPKFHKTRPVPYSLRPLVEAELDRLEGVVTKVSHSAWAAPVVVVPKADGGICLCADFKVTVNQILDVDKYPLPNAQDLLSSLAGGTRFTKLDLKHAYQQLPLSEDSKHFLTINTSKGLYQNNRLSFGVASAPAIFQSTMDTILKGIDGVVCYIDDILITGRNDQEHRNRLEAVLSRLERYGVQLKLSKCSFPQEKVQFLGHVIDAEGFTHHPRRCRPLLKLRLLLMLQSYGPSSECSSTMGNFYLICRHCCTRSTTLHDRILEDFHADHPGVCRMKSLARSYLWWPSLDKAIESVVQNCTACQSTRPAIAPLVPWKWPVRVWQRVHMDYAEKDSVYFFVVVDAHSKWPEVFSTSSTTTYKNITCI